MKNLIKSIFVLLFLNLNIVFSQLNINLSYNGYADNNLFRSPQSVSDFLSSAKLRTSYRFDKEGLTIYNNINLLGYKEYSERNFLTNNIGLSKHFKLGENQFSNMYLGGNWNLRANKEDYEYYNYSQLSGYLNLQLFTNIALFKGGYSYRWREYINWSGLSNHLHNVFFQINKSLPTRTTLILETGFGNKSFIGKDSITTTIKTGQGNGNRSGTSTITKAISKPLNTSQINLTLRLSQSINDKTGLFVQYRKQISMDDETSYQNFDDYYQDDELFDDPYTYESDAYSTQLTIMLPESSKILIGGSYHDKNYISEKILIDENDVLGANDLRIDNQYIAFVDISKIFNVRKDWLNSIKLNIYFTYTNNESNSYWYNYENSAFGGGIQINF